MRSLTLPLALLLLIAGCQGEPTARRNSEAASLFAASAMRIHPIFTQIKNWSGKGKPDGVEALIEFQDQFGDPTKAAGQVIFELYDYRRGSADPRGNRVVNPWVGSLQTSADQREHWNRTSRTYSFQLAYDRIRTDHPYVLTAIFELSSGGRFFDRIILEPPSKEPTLDTPATRPHGQPSIRIPQP